MSMDTSAGTMSYDRLMREHEAIEALADALASAARGAAAPDVASKLLGRLAMAIRDHMAAEEGTLAATLDAALRNRHHAAAASAMLDVEYLREDWTAYLYRWTREGIAADWQRFATETLAIMERIRDRLARETGILYSLALHYRLIAPER